MILRNELIYLKLAIDNAEDKKSKKKKRRRKRRKKTRKNRKILLLIGTNQINHFLKYSNI